ncbi:hypothetical protein [Microbacterium sp. 4-7]|uniref:hypothetical protein n=1 Tax=Microbacterium sp. 4-7 TaxID=1885327 RepID=UPI001650908D|nr:hypothetical protein [Microbacterium sp. 4-7]
MTLTSEDRNNVTIALTTFADLGDSLMAEFRSTAPPEGSPIVIWGDDRLAGDQVVPTFTAINGAILSGADHLRSLNHLARVATTTSVTVARGAVEAYAHAAHLATAPSATEFADRHLSALHKEYEFLVTHSALLTNLDGAVLDAATEQSKVDADRQRIGLGKAAPAGMTCGACDEPPPGRVRLQAPPHPSAPAPQGRMARRPRGPGDARR